MPTAFPFPAPERLPLKITPCPIVEAVMEVRFVPNRPWDHFPGLFAEKFGPRYPKEEDTGVSQIPQVLRERDQSLAHLPYRRFIGDHFTLLTGPHVVGLATKHNAYPGWDSFWQEMTQVLVGLQQMGIVRETTRLGLRYINFFVFDVFDHLSLSLNVVGNPMKNPETGVSTVLVQTPFRHLLQINNSAVIAGSDKQPKLGSILDIDTSITAKVHHIFDQAEALFRQAHIAEKGLFFGLLKPSFVATLNPEY